MRGNEKEEIAEAMKALEASFKQHSEGQMAKFTSLLEQFMANTEIRLSQLSHAPKDSFVS